MKAETDVIQYQLIPFVFVLWEKEPKSIVETIQKENRLYNLLSLLLFF